MKIQVVVDVKRKRVLSVEVTDEKVHERENFKPLVKKAKVKKVFGDGGYDSHDNFEFLSSEGIEAGIKVRRSSRIDCGGARRGVVRAYLREPLSWNRGIGYGRRWIV